MNPPKINPAILRLLVIFPNVLSYILLFGIIVYFVTDYSYLSHNNAVATWYIFLAIFAPITGYTSYSIMKRIRAGVL